MEDTEQLSEIAGLIRDMAKDDEMDLSDGESLVLAMLMLMSKRQQESMGKIVEAINAIPGCEH